jgi:hypothetical protein
MKSIYKDRKRKTEEEMDNITKKREKKEQERDKQKSRIRKEHTNTERNTRVKQTYEHKVNGAKSNKGTAKRREK